MADLIARAKKEPGKLSFGSGSSSSRVAGELFKQMTGTDIMHVPYKSNPLAITDLLGGQIDMMITDMSTGVPQIKAGKLRALGVSDAKRIAAAARRADHRRGRREGLRHGLLVRRLRAREHAAAVVPAAARAAAPPAPRRGRERLLPEQRQPAPSTTTRDGLAQFQAAESQKWGRVVKAAGIEPE